MPHTTPSFTLFCLVTPWTLIDIAGMLELDFHHIASGCCVQLFHHVLQTLPSSVIVSIIHPRVTPFMQSFVAHVEALIQTDNHHQTKHPAQPALLLVGSRFLLIDLKQFADQDCRCVTLAVLLLTCRTAAESSCLLM